MMKKLGTLSHVLAGLAGKPQPSIKTHDDAGYPIQPSRRNKKALMAWVDHAVAAQLREIAYEEETTQQALIREALESDVQEAWEA